MTRLIYVLSATLAACVPSTDYSSSGPDAGSGSGGGGGGGGGGNTNDAYYRFTGTLPTTATVPFGGDPYCDYDMRLSNVVVDIVLRETGHLVSSIVSDTTNERSLNGCPHNPAPPSAQLFEHRGSPIAGSNSFATTLQGSSSNTPNTGLDLKISAPSNAFPKADVRWTRLDQPAPLDWRVDVVGLELPSIPCDAGGSVCIGREAGALYTCTDGIRMELSKQCAAGCGSPTSCN